MWELKSGVAYICIIIIFYNNNNKRNNIYKTQLSRNKELIL